MTNKQSMKQRGEDAAAAHLERCGVCVVERRWRCDAGVIDIIGFDGDRLVLVGVQTRRAAGQMGSQPVSAAVTRRVRRLADEYIRYADLEDQAWRYDRIDLLVIADDRALLRHHRDVISA